MNLSCYRVRCGVVSGLGSDHPPLICVFVINNTPIDFGILTLPYAIGRVCACSAECDDKTMSQIQASLQAPPQNEHHHLSSFWQGL